MMLRTLKNPENAPWLFRSETRANTMMVPESADGTRRAAHTATDEASRAHPDAARNATATARATALISSPTMNVLRT